MSDLRDWLRSNKFEQYADAFEANDIDLDILPELSERDLEQLGLSLGNRRRLLKAIAERGIAKSKPSDAEAGEDEREDHRRCLGRDHYAMAVVAVGNDAAQWGGQKDRKLTGEPD